MKHTIDLGPVTLQPGTVAIDIETTGLDPVRHSAIEFAASAWDGRTIYSTFRMRPGRSIDAEALRVNGASIEGLDCREPGYFQAMEDLFEWLEDLRDDHGQQLVLAGMNPHFDAGFLDAEWDLLYAAKGKRYRRPWSHRHYDLHTLAVQYAAIFGKESGRLHSDGISRLLGVAEEPKPHCAMGGVQWSLRCFAKINDNLRKLEEALK